MNARGVKKRLKRVASSRIISIIRIKETMKNARTALANAKPVITPFFKCFIFYKHRTGLSTELNMSGQKKFFKTRQHVPLTVKELKSSLSLGDSTYETVNEIKYSNVEMVMMVQSVKAKEDSVSVILNTTLLETPESLLAYGGMYTDERLIEQLSMLQSYSIVIIRGRVSMYSKEDDDEIRYSLFPHQVIELDPTNGNDTKFRDLWYLRLLDSRIKNGYPLVENDELHYLAEKEGITTDIKDSLVFIEGNVYISRSVEIPAIDPTSHAGTAITSNPSKKPALQKKIGRKNIDLESIIRQVKEGSDLDDGEIAARIDEITEGGLLSRKAAAMKLAKLMEIDIDISANDFVPSGKKPVARKVTMKKKGEKTIYDVIKEILKEKGGNMSLGGLYKVMTEKGYKNNVTEDKIMEMYSNGSIELDDESVKLK